MAALLHLRAACLLFIRDLSAFRRAARLHLCACRGLFWSVKRYPNLSRLTTQSYLMRSGKTLAGIPGYPVSLFWVVPVVFVALTIKMSFLLLPTEESPLKEGASITSSKFWVSWDVNWTDRLSIHVKWTVRLSIQRKVFGWRRQWGTLL